MIELFCALWELELVFANDSESLIGTLSSTMKKHDKIYVIFSYLKWIKKMGIKKMGRVRSAGTWKGVQGSLGTQSQVKDSIKGHCCNTWSYLSLSLL